jgi:predicted site-specific integrase-resolvase
MSDLLKSEEAARILTVSEVTLRRWRQRKNGPVFVRLSKGTIRYKQSDIEAYLNERRQQ